MISTLAFHPFAGCATCIFIMSVEPAEAAGLIGAIHRSSGIIQEDAYLRDLWSLWLNSTIQCSIRVLIARAVRQDATWHQTHLSLIFGS